MNKGVLFSLVFLLSIVILSGCQSSKKMPSKYVERAYIEQSEQKNVPRRIPRMDEEKADNVIINMDHYIDSDWEKQPYETPEEWVDRMRNILEINEDALVLAREEIDAEMLLERQLSGKAQELTRRNNKLLSMIALPKEQSGREGSQIANLRPAPFTVHLVKHGETLFSLAMKYYEKGSKVKDIALWNQGWIRHPDDIIAGLGIVLFPDELQEKSQKVVDRYMKKVRNPTNDF